MVRVVLVQVCSHVVQRVETLASLQKMIHIVGVIERYIMVLLTSVAMATLSISSMAGRRVGNISFSRYSSGDSVQKVNSEVLGWSTTHQDLCSHTK